MKRSNYSSRSSSYKNQSNDVVHHPQQQQQQQEPLVLCPSKKRTYNLKRKQHWCIVVGLVIAIKVFIDVSVVELSSIPANKVTSISNNDFSRNDTKKPQIFEGKENKNKKEIVLLKKQSLVVNTTISPQNLALYQSVSKVLPLLNETNLPILNMGLMKSGTTSIEAYFRCGFPTPKLQSLVTHYDCYPYKSYQRRAANYEARMVCGKKMRTNLKRNLLVFDSIDQFLVYAEIDGYEKNGGMTLPQWDYLEEIYAYFPNATWILNLRDPSKWLSSINRWRDLRQRFIDNRFGHFYKGMGEKDEDMLAFYQNQTDRVRQFVKSHPSIKLIELKIDDDDNAGKTLEQHFGISSELCWGNRNVNMENPLNDTKKPQIFEGKENKNKKEIVLLKKQSLVVNTTISPQNLALYQSVSKVLPLLNETNLPILNMGLMKSGTTSIEAYFRCGFPTPKLQSLVTHYDCYPYKSYQRRAANYEARMVCGKKMRTNLKRNLLVFDSIDQFLVYAEIDGYEKNGGMTLPQWDYLEEIYAYFPNATWILNLRDPSKWLSSINRWRDLRQRFIDNRFGHFYKGMGEKDEDMLAFYQNQTDRVRQFVKSHPSIKLIELKIDDDDNAGKTLEQHFGISSELCWGNRNVNMENPLN